MEFNYGETLRIRSDLYTILGKIRYIDTHGHIWIRSEMRTSFPSCVVKHSP